MVNFSEMELLDIIPFVVFGGTLLVIFGVFISGAINLLFSRNNEERGRDTIAKSLSYFVILLMIFLVFIIVSSIIRRGEVFQPQEGETEFPASPMGSFPPHPEFMEINGYSFSGPYPLAEKNHLEEETDYVILCKKEEGYDTIYLGIGNKRNSISSSRDYECWVENCNQEDLWVGLFWVNDDLEKSTRDYLKELEKNIKTICE